MVHSLEFTFERATKNTYRFSEVAAPGEAVVGYLYVQKSAFTTQPARVKVTIEDGTSESST